MEDILNYFNLEDDLNFLILEDNLKYFKEEDDLKYFNKEEDLKYFNLVDNINYSTWKTTSNICVHGWRSQIIYFENGRYSMISDHLVKSQPGINCYQVWLLGPHLAC